MSGKDIADYETVPMQRVLTLRAHLAKNRDSAMAAGDTVGYSVMVKVLQDFDAVLLPVQAPVTH